MSFSSQYAKQAVTVNIDYFDPSTIRKSSIVFIIGKRGSGKSTVAEDIMSFHTDIKEGICISKTDKMNEFWTPHLPPLFIHHEYDQSITYKLLSHQEDKWQQHKKECRKRGEKPVIDDIEPAFAIYDDITYDKSFLKDKATRELFMNGRHYNILIVITCQYLMDIGPDLRGQIDYVITLKDNIKNNRAKMYEYFAGVFPTFAAFDKTFVMCTDNREALVIFNSSLSHDIRSCAFFYRAKPDRVYKLGSEGYWNYSAANYDTDNDSDAEDAKFAGMSMKDKERARSFDVRKRYPGEQPSDNDENDSDDCGGNSSSDEAGGFAPKKRGHYGSMYKHRSVQPRLLANARAQKRRKPPPGYLDNLANPSLPPPGPMPLITPLQHREGHDGHGHGHGHDRSRRHRHGRRHRKTVEQPVLKSRSTGRARTRLKTDIEEPFAPFETFGNKILKRIDREKAMGPRSLHKKKKKSKKQKRREKRMSRAAKAEAKQREKIRESEAVRKARRDAMSDQLFLY